MNRISHWIDGKVVEGTSGALRHGVQPGDGGAAAASTSPRRRGRRRRGVRRAAFPAWRATSLAAGPR